MRNRRGKNGECYLLANEDLYYRDFFRIVATRSTSRTCMLRLFRWLLLAVGILGNCAACLGFCGEINRINMQILCIKNYYSNTKFINEPFSYVSIYFGELRTIRLRDSLSIPSLVERFFISNSRVVENYFKRQAVKNCQKIISEYRLLIL